MVRTAPYLGNISSLNVEDHFHNSTGFHVEWNACSRSFFFPHGGEYEDYRRTLHLQEYHPERGETMPELPEERIDPGTVCAFWDDTDDTHFVVAKYDGQYADQGRIRHSCNGFDYDHAAIFKGELPEGFEFKNDK